MNGTLEKLKPPCWQGVGGVGGWGGNTAFVDMQLFNFSSFSPHFPHSPHSKILLYQGFAINKRAIRDWAQEAEGKDLLLLLPCSSAPLLPCSPAPLFP
ncbi:MAG: hypothetical protein V7K71_04575 [Nostoc sp.]|uniref:hypothetical protein n=1 Tax=Nostoc sp. TaxID=1180 RepID=UPI002FFBFCDC